jgi:hypothetical protein
MTKPKEQTEKTKTQKQHDLEELDKLIASRGWAILHEVMEKEITKSALMLADNRPISIDEINFQRGAIWAAHRLLTLPDRLKQILLNDVILESHPTTKEQNLNGK